MRVLSDLARLAGQFGIATDDIVEFTEVMALLSVTIDDLDVEAAASAIARLATIMGVASDEFDNLGSTLVDLGNKFASAEGDILNLAGRIAGAGKIIGLSAQEVFGIANAFAVVVGPQGIEAAGTAVQKVFLALNTSVLQGGESLEKFAKVAGLSAGEFKKLFQKDAAKAFRLFVEGLGKQGKKGELILRDLGLTDARLIRSFLQIAGAGDLLKRSLDTATTAFAENVALQEEARKRFETLASQIQLLKNNIFELGIQLGEILKPALIGAIKQFSGALDDIGKKLVPGFKAFAQVLPEVVGLVISLIKALADMATGFLELVAQLGPSIELLGEFFETVGKGSRFIFGELTPAVEALNAGLQNIREVLGTAFGNIKTQGLEALRSLMAGLGEVVTAALNGIAQAIPLVVPLLLEMVQAFSTLVNAVGPDLQNFVQQVVERLGQLAAAFADVLSIVAGPVLRVLAEVFDEIGNVVIELARHIVDTAGPAINALADSFVQFIDALGPSVLEVLKSLVDAFVTLQPALSRLLETLAPLIAQIAGGLTEAIAPLADAFSRIIIALLPVLQTIVNVLTGPFLDAVIKLAPAFAKFIETLAPLATGLFLGIGELFEAFVPVLLALLPAIEALVEPLLGLVQAFIPLAEILAGALIEAIETITPALPNLVEAFVQLVEALTPILADTLTNLAIAMAKLFTALAGNDAATKVILALATILEVLARALAGLEPETLEKLIVAFIGLKIFSSVGRAIFAFGQAVRGFRDGLSILKTVGKPLRTALNGIAGAGKGFLRGIPSVIGGIKRFVGPEGIGLFTRTRGVGGQITKSLEFNPANFLARLRGLGTSAAEAISSGAATVKGGVTRLLSPVTSVAKTIFQEAATKTGLFKKVVTQSRDELGRFKEGITKLRFQPTQFLDDLKSLPGKFATTFTKIKDGFSSVSRTGLSKFGELAKFLKGGFSTAITTLGKTLSTQLLGGSSGSLIAGAGGTAVGLLGAIAAGVGLGVALHNLIEDHFPGINRALEDLGGAISDFLFGTGAEGQIGLIGEIGTFFKDLGGKLFDAVLTGLEAFLNFLLKFRFAFPGNVDRALQSAKDDIHAARGLAKGGFLKAGRFAIVGEEGPEPVVFGRDARVFSNKDFRKAMSSSGGGETTFNIYEAVDAQATAVAVEQRLGRNARR